MITAIRPHGDPAGYSPVIRVEFFSTPAPTAPTSATEMPVSRIEQSRREP